MSSKSVTGDKFVVFFISLSQTWSHTYSHLATGIGLPCRVEVKRHTGNERRQLPGIEGNVNRWRQANG